MGVVINENMATSGGLNQHKKRKYAYKKKTKSFRGSKERLQTKLNVVDTEKDVVLWT